MLHPRGEARRAGKFFRQSHKAWLSYDARRWGGATVGVIGISRMS